MSDQKLCPTCGTEYPLSERFCPRDGSALRSANAQADLLGSIIADRYHILKKLGEGGMGTVYLAEHVKMGRKSALKVMNPGMNTDPDAIARFNREASNASRLSHPNICGIYDFGETSDGIIYLAMEFIEGSSLTSLIETAGSLPAPRAASIIHQTGDALQVAHDAGIVHRDLKPDNIMITRNRDGSDLVKVVDFGIAKASSSDAQKVTKTGLVVGTPEYMSPEQLAGDKLDGRSDIYSLGLVAFNCLTGKLPFPAETAQEAMIMRLTDQPKTLAEVKGNVVWSPELQATLDKALQRDAEERYASAAKFGRDFAAAIAAMPLTAAAEAGTMIVGAQGGGAETPLLATRVSRNSAATVSVDAARTPKKAAPAAAGAAAAPRGVATKKSSLPMVFGGLGGAAAIAVVAWQMGFIGGTGESGGTTTAPLGVDASRASAETLRVADASNTPPIDPASTKSANSRDPGPSKSGVPTGGENRPTGGETKSPGGGEPTSVVNVSQQLERWLAIAQDTTSTTNMLRRIVQDLESLRPTLRGSQLAESWYVELNAYAATGDPAACNAARKVLEHATERSRRDLANIMLSQDACKVRQ